MTFPYAITLALWLVPLMLQTATMVVMLRRQLTKVFPAFFAYTFVVVSRDLILLVIPYATNLYSLVYWSGDGLAVLLGLGVVLEIVQTWVKPFHFMRPVRRAIWVFSGVVTLVALAILIFSNPGTGPDRALESIVETERALRFLQVCLLSVVIGLTSRLGLTWQHYSVGIVAGFGIYAALDLMALEFRADLHFLPDEAFIWIRPAAYNLAAIVWASYFLRRPNSETIVARLPIPDTADWNEVLTDYVQQWYRRF